MKTLNSLFAAFLIMTMTFGVSGLRAQQKLAYVDSEYIMANIPEYEDAQEELNSMSTQWQNEIKAIYDKVEQMYRDYKTESVLLSEEQKVAREQAIINKEQEAKNLQMRYFGSDGELFQKRSELIQPIQEKIYTAINDMAKQKGYAFVFDLASGTSILYASDKNDISDDVLDELGNVMQTVRRDERRKAGSEGSSAPKSTSKSSASSGKK